jgi:CPA2 family monovalent cation:H+ antiporter-2
VVGIIHNGELYPNPDASYQFTAGDLVAAMGNAEQLAAFQELAAPAQR